MKNVLIISTTEEEMLSNVNDGTNRLFINGSEIPSADWVGTGNYTATVEGHAVTIAKADTLDGNISLARTGDYTYEMRKRTPSSGTGVESIVQTTTSHEDGGINVVTCTLTDGTQTTFDIQNGQKGSTGAAAGFGTPTASVDANIGTPSVTVTASGADTAKVFDFSFHNLKGEKGDTITYDLGCLNTESNYTIENYYSDFVNAHRGEHNIEGRFYITSSNTPTDIPANTTSWTYSYGRFIVRNIASNGNNDGLIELIPYGGYLKAYKTCENNAFYGWFIEGDEGFVHTSDVSYNPDTKKVTVRKTNERTWDSQIYSKVGYKDDVLVTFKPSSTGMYFMIGLNTDPASSPSFQFIDYCFFCQGDGSLNIFESGTQIYLPTGHTTYAAGDELTIKYSAGYVRYYHNGVLVRSVARSIGSPLYMDSSFYNSGSAYDIDFGKGLGSIFDDDYLVVESVQKNVGLTLAAGGAGGYSIDISKNGYTPIGVLGLLGSGTSSFALQEFYIDGNLARGYVRNIISSSATLTSMRFTILYKRSL